MIYQFSRAMYRALADGVGGRPGADHIRVLRACEATLERMANDRYYFASPVRSLTRDLRPYFPLPQQARMHTVVERYLALFDAWLMRQFATGYDLAGRKLHCRAMTRRSTPCQRPPYPRNGYCPCHQHLADREADAVTLPVVSRPRRRSRGGAGRRQLAGVAPA